MATFVSSKCKANLPNQCARCTHPRCAHECHQVEAAPTSTNGDGASEISGGDPDRELAPTPPAPDADAVAAGVSPDNEISGGGDSEDGMATPQGAAVASEAPAGEPLDDGGTFELLAIDRIVPSPDNVRRNLGELDELAASIKAVGIVEPLIVERCDDDEEHDYHLVAGERRWTAAGMVGLMLVPAIVRPPLVDVDRRVELMLIENLQRKDLEPLEEAEGYRRLTEYGMTQVTIAERVGCSQSHVSKRLQLLDLAPKVVDAVNAGKVSVSDALELGKLDDHKRQEAALKEAKKTSYGGHELGVEWAVDQQVAQIQRAEKLEKIEAEAKKKGWTLIKSGSKRAYERVAPDQYYSGVHVDLKGHRKEPCHAIYVDDGYGGPHKVEVCLEPGRHRGKGESELKEPPKAKRETDPFDARQREEQKGKRDAGGRRVEHLKGVLAKKVAKDTALQLLAASTLDEADHGIQKRACELLGLGEGTNVEPRSVIGTEAAKSPDDLVRVAVACTLARGDMWAQQSWNGWESGPIERLYGFLTARGYELNEFEQGQIEKRQRQEAENAAARASFIEKHVDPLDLPGVVKESLRSVVGRLTALEFAEFEDEHGDASVTAWWYVCRVCGCTEDNACEGGCSWVEADLCSSCAPVADSDGITDGGGGEEQELVAP
jgi:ParB/RepB/Spo0J family partition protein